MGNKNFQNLKNLTKTGYTNEYFELYDGILMENNQEVSILEGKKDLEKYLKVKNI
jgi:hypothetical protein